MLTRQPSVSCPRAVDPARQVQGSRMHAPQPVTQSGVRRFKKPRRWQESRSVGGPPTGTSQKVRTESAKRAWEMAGMDTQPNCEARSSSFWKRPADRRFTRQAINFRSRLPSGLPSPSVSANSIGFVLPWASAIRPNLRKKSEQISQRAGVAGRGRSLVITG